MLAQEGIKKKGQKGREKKVNVVLIKEKNRTRKGRKRGEVGKKFKEKGLM